MNLRRKEMEEKCMQYFLIVFMIFLVDCFVGPLNLANSVLLAILYSVLLSHSHIVCAYSFLVCNILVLLTVNGQLFISLSY